MIYKNGQPLHGKINWVEVLRYIDDSDIFIATTNIEYTALQAAMRRNFYKSLSGKIKDKYIVKIISAELFKKLKNFV
tara:strand:- start:179 stop:409 length:231 start_codon:yes stop_codon:yes gene_type:complete